MFLKNNSKNAVYALSLIFINLYLFSKLTLLYDITESPDFNIYKQYVYYFFGLSEQSKLDNGSIYFILFLYFSVLMKAVMLEIII